MAVKKLGVYKCDLCGNIVEVLNAQQGDLVCCGQKMTLLEENTVEASKEKHIPVAEKIAENLKITVGSVEHPMEEKHYIEWIEVITDKKVCRAELSPGEKPAALFCAPDGKYSVRAYCNLHGLWKGE